VTDRSPDPAALLAACARGERAALQRLYQHEAPLLLGIVLRLVRDRGLAEDILHDAFLRIWRGAAGFAPERGSARGWMCSIARNLALNALRDRQRLVPLADEWEPLAESADPAREADGRRLEGCLQNLEAPRREAILAAYLDGCSHGEIAQRLQAPLGTVKSWITRGLKALRECMT